MSRLLTHKIFKFKIPISLIILSVPILGFICTGMVDHVSMHGMSMDSAGAMTILGANQQECCNTRVSKSIDTWKDIVLAVPGKVRDTVMLLALGLALIFGYRWMSPRNQRLLVEPHTGRLRLYIRHNPDLTLFNHLKFVFARGILNQKIY